MSNPGPATTISGNDFVLPKSSDIPAAIADIATTGSTTTTPYGFTTSAQADAIMTKLNLILAALRDKNIIAT